MRARFQFSAKILPRSLYDGDKHSYNTAKRVRGDKYTTYTCTQPVFGCLQYFIYAYVVGYTSYRRRGYFRYRTGNQNFDHEHPNFRKSHHQCQGPGYFI
jgi:hypothetical protein